MPEPIRPNVQTFIGCDAEYDAARVVLFGAPFDSTTSFRPGARFGPQAMRAESVGIETYSPYQDADLENVSIMDAGDLDLPFGNAASALDKIERFAARVLGDGKKPCLIGGEHLVTLGAVRAAFKAHPDLRILHFDAHADLRDDYMGEKLSHATVIRRIWEMTGDGKIFQFGIRSGSADEMHWSREHVQRELFTADTIADAVSKIGDAPVYVTVDLDVVDPAEFPGTGTPEAGGLSFTQLHRALMATKKCNVVAFDVCELAPHYDHSGQSTALACKALREMLLAYAGSA
ncbi:agmatinase [Synergistaceae bacterium OttesenSCG-928-I11]|nr:agmatinase [Synergistaceae bacterium OttesenSCG-928-I11]